MNTDKDKKETNIYDLLITIMDGMFNLKISNGVSLVLLWIIIRDIICFFRLPNNYDFSKWMFNTTKTLEYIFEDDRVYFIFISIILILLMLIIILILRIIQLKKEIKRVSELRKILIHGIGEGDLNILKEHNSTNVTKRR